MVRSYAEGGSLGFACPPAISKLVTLRMLVVSSGLLTPSKLVVVDASKKAANSCGSTPLLRVIARLF